MQLTIVDARMGRGKTSAAIRYIREHKDDFPILFVTPYLSETERVCEACDLEQPDDSFGAKLTSLKHHLQAGESICATHSLFLYIDRECLSYIRAHHYHLIVDEAIDVAGTMSGLSRYDIRYIMENTNADDDGRLTWSDAEYEGKFSAEKNLADCGELYSIGGYLITVVSPDVFEAFERCYLLTYLHRAQLSTLYFEFFHIPFNVVGVETDAGGWKFSDKPDNPPPVDYKELIHIVEDKSCKMKLFQGTALSKSWFQKELIGCKKEVPSMTHLRNGLRNFKEHLSSGDPKKTMWTTFKAFADQVRGNRVSSKYFVALNARATNQYRDKTDLAFLCNIYPDPNMQKFFAKGDVHMDKDQYALSVLIQWVFRSAIRDGKPINVYIPSWRMRSLLKQWIADVAKGGASA